MKMLEFINNEESNKPEVIFDRVIDRLNEMRDGDCNKGTFGTLSCICGSYGMAGAAMLCGSAAVTAGAGLVKMIIPESIYSICASNLWENVFVPLSSSKSGTISSDSIDRIIEEVNSSTAAVIGCGLKVSDDTIAICDSVIKNTARPLIIDADGLNCVSLHTDILLQRKAPTIITPHPGEMSRLCVSSVSDVQSNRLDTAVNFAKKHRCIVVLKGVNTIITNGKDVVVNPTGNGCLAKGGSGDVLAGLIGALVCQGIDCFQAAVAGVYLHGFAADECIDEISSSCVTARDIIFAVKYLM